MQQARRMGAPRATALCQCFNGALEFQAGHWPQAEAALHESIQLYRQIGAASGEALACQRLGLLQTARGQLDQAMTTLAEGVMAAKRGLLRAHCLARLYATMARNRLNAGDISAADQSLSLGLAMSDRHGHCHTCDSLLLPAAVSLRLAQGNLAAAELFCAELDRLAQQYASRTWVAMAYQSRGELFAAQEQLDRSLSCYISAYQAYIRMENRYEIARCLKAMADLRLARNAPGDIEAAHIARAEARQIFQELGVKSY
jgi:predicted negative regulator of RcsB-dependent stress response